MSYGETRTYLGRSQAKIHRINGEESWQDSVDARRTVQRLPEEWSFTPFSEAKQKEARKEMPLTDRAQAVPSEGHGPG
ncbi:hypothetical protein GOB17_23055 [Sinorhizobium meliloti]|uniref:hypothetical protein n=1 Tax=Rhizobium meliloti TaxID=382 RepID=UPI00299D8F0D|nr:hypothetical protein [Sinorhizobium meliloti]